MLSSTTQPLVNQVTGSTSPGSTPWLEALPDDVISIIRLHSSSGNFHNLSGTSSRIRSRVLQYVDYAICRTQQAVASLHFYVTTTSKTRGSDFSILGANLRFLVIERTAFREADDECNYPKTLVDEVAKLLVEIVENTTDLRRLRLGSESGGMETLVEHLGPERFQNAITQLKSLTHLTWCINMRVDARLLPSEVPQYPANICRLHILSNIQHVPITMLFRSIALANLRRLDTLVITDYNEAPGVAEKEYLDIAENDSDARPGSLPLHGVHKLVLVGCQVYSVDYSSLQQFFPSLDSLYVSDCGLECNPEQPPGRIHQLTLVNIRAASDDSFYACQPNRLTCISTRSPDTSPLFFPKPCDCSALVGLTLRLPGIGTGALEEISEDGPAQLSWLELESIYSGLKPILSDIVSDRATVILTWSLTTFCCTQERKFAEPRFSEKCSDLLCLSLLAIQLDPVSANEESPGKIKEGEVINLISHIASALILLQLKLKLWWKTRSPTRNCLPVSSEGLQAPFVAYATLHLPSLSTRCQSQWIRQKR